MEILSSEMQNDLLVLWKIHSDIEFQRTSKSSDWLENRLRELLERVRHFVSKYGPENYTISVGVPMGAGVSFTWTTKAADNPGMTIMGGSSNL